MKRSIVGAIGILLLAGPSVAAPINIPIPGFVINQPHTIESATEVRIKACRELGGSQENCECRAETAAKHMAKDDFLRETSFIESGDTLGLQEFRNRLIDEQPRMMMSLGQALQHCPTVRMDLE
ncbi:MAG: hypothetical protein NXH72_04110 [Hyphomonadaceae bacterium]|nr:hypothetical protein [Hyphomonadaceae bacterium]